MVREYEQTHPWLTFIFDTTKFSHRIWMLLGAAQSKCRHIQGVPLDEQHAHELYKVYLVRGARATTAIEGNTLSEEEVRNILDNKSTIPPSRHYLEQEVKNVLTAYESIANSQMTDESTKLSIEEICQYNKMILHNLKLDDDTIPGQIRQHSVIVGRYKGAPAQDCSFLLEKLCQTINDTHFTLGNGWSYATGILKAIIAHIYLAWIHPFGDGNGRTARLIEVKLCAEAGLPKPACQLLSNFYNITRNEYYRQLEQASRKSDITDFIEYALNGMVDMLDEQIEIIKKYQIHSTWENVVHNTIRGHTSVAERRRHVALDLYNFEEGVSKNQLKILTPRLAREYTNATARKIARDVKALQELNIVIVKNKRIYANIDKILAWLPMRRIVTVE